MRRRQCRERRVELALRPQALGQEHVEARAPGLGRDRRVELPLGVARASEAQEERRQGLDELDVAGRVVGRALQRPRRRRGQLRIDDGTRGGLEPQRGEAFDGVASFGRVADGAAQVQHRREPVVGATAKRVVQRAALGAQHALERFPLELLEPSQRADRAVELRPQELERPYERRPGVRGVERDLDLRARLARARIEGQKLQGAAAQRGRLDRIP